MTASFLGMKSTNLGCRVSPAKLFGLLLSPSELVVAGASAARVIQRSYAICYLSQPLSGFALCGLFSGRLFVASGDSFMQICYLESTISGCAEFFWNLPFVACSQAVFGVLQIYANSLLSTISGCTEFFCIYFSLVPQVDPLSLFLESCAISLF